ncbi:MAG: LOG family protein [Candidatus Omnitrophota bacterium]
MANKKICIFGSYKSFENKERENIVTLGRLLAGKGFDIISGGFGGTMEDVSRGAKSAGGKTIGVTYYKWENISEKPPYKGPNKYIDEEIRTQNIFERIDVMMKNAHAFIVLPGGTGTLLELSACLEFINKGLMEPKPIIALGNFWKGAIERLAEEPVLSKLAKALQNVTTCRDLVTFVDTVEEAVSLL